MAAKVEQNFRLMVGEDRTLTFSVFESDGTTAKNISGATVSSVFKTHPLSANAVLTIAGTNVGSGTDNNQFSVVVADTDTDSLEPRVYHHTAKVTDSSSNETFVARGTANLNPA